MITLVKSGERIALHPATDLWAMGARYGNVTHTLVGGRFMRINADNYGHVIVNADAVLKVVS